MNRYFDNLYLCSFDEKTQRNSGGYMFAVRRIGSAHTAFRTSLALESWLKLVKLRAAVTRDEGNILGCVDLIGGYKTYTSTSLDEFEAIESNKYFLSLGNGSYHCGKVTEDKQGIVTLNNYFLGVSNYTWALNTTDSQQAIDSGFFEVSKDVYLEWLKKNRNLLNELADRNRP